MVWPEKSQEIHKDKVIKSLVELTLISGRLVCIGVCLCL